MIELLRGVGGYIAVCWRTDRRRVVISALLVLAESAALPLAAPAMATLTDAAVAGDARDGVIAALFVAVAVIAALTAGHFAHIYYFELGEATSLSFDRDLIELTNGSAGLEHHERPDYADKLEVLRTETSRASFQSIQAVLNSFGLLLAISITAVLLARLDPVLLLLPLAAVPPLLLGRRAESIVARAREDAAQDNRRARHLLRLGTEPGATKELRVGNLAAEIRARHAASFTRASATMLRAENRAALVRLAGQLAFALAYVAATLLVLRNTVRGSGTVGDVVLVLVLASQVNGQVTAAVAVLQTLQRTAQTMISYEWVRRLVTAAPSHGILADAQVPDRLSVGITFTGVSFTYPGSERPVLAGVDLHLPAGSTVAIVGENGAGKTTLVKLLSRFYETTAGVITVDGTDLRRLPLDGWRPRIAAGFQDFARFELLVRQTVGVGHLPEIDSEGAVLAALHRANGQDVLRRLGDGLSTQLGLSADGTELSGGQWQKLALGRAMMRRSPLLLVLDEPTSALDAQAEHRLFEQYAASARRVGEQTGAVTLLVSHRFSTVRMADLILVIAAGRIVESGSHEELMGRGGLYADLYELQAAAYR